MVKESQRMQPEPLQNWKDRIVIDEAILTGKPIIKGTRLAVEFIIDLLVHGWSEADILENYPDIVLEISAPVSLMPVRSYTRKRFKRKKTWTKIFNAGSEK